MGQSLSCGGCQYGACLNATSLLTGPTSYRFAAEIFKLSDDRSEWVKVHPSVLSVTVSKTLNNPESIAELSAANLKHQNVFRVPIHKDSEIKKYSERFVYWKSQNDSTYALNVVSKTDVDQFCAVASNSSNYPSTPALCQKFKCEMAPLMSARHGHIVEQEHLRLNDCSIVFTAPDLIQFYDKDDKHLISTSAHELVLSVNESRRLIFLSFPSKAMALYFKQQDELKTFLQTVLNESSMFLAENTRSTDHTVFYLNRALDTVVSMIKTPSFLDTPSTSGVDLCADPRLPGNAAAASKHYIETLYTLKYMLIFRIALLKGVIPNNNFCEMIYPTQLRAKVTSGHLANYVHLYCCLHAQFSIKKQLKDISDSAQFSKMIEKTIRKASENQLLQEQQQQQETGEKTLSKDQKDVQSTRNILNERLLKSIIELVETEDAFVKDLDQLIQQYIKQGELTFLDSTEKLLKTHQIFLASLQDAGGDLLEANSSVESLDYAQIKDAVMRVSALFINKCNKFKIYSEYSSAYLRFQHLYTTDVQLKEKMEQLNHSREHKESIQSLLIKPIQRVLKYPLFLEQIKDFCSKDSIEQKQCVQALSRMQTLATYVNEMQRIHEEYGSELERLSNLPELKSKNLWIDLKELFMFAHLKWIKQGDKKYTDCVAFVFTSLILVLGTEQAKKNKNSKTFKIFPILEIELSEAAASTSAADQKNNNNEMVTSSSSMDSNMTSASNNLQQQQQQQHYFSLIHLNMTDSTKNDQNYHFSCCHSDIKVHFVKSVKKALKSYLKQKPRPISGSSQSDWGYSSAH